MLPLPHDSTPSATPRAALPPFRRLCSRARIEAVSLATRGARCSGRSGRSCSAVAMGGRVSRVPRRAYCAVVRAASGGGDAGGVVSSHRRAPRSGATGVSPRRIAQQFCFVYGAEAFIGRLRCEWRCGWLGGNSAVLSSRFFSVAQPHLGPIPELQPTKRTIFVVLTKLFMGGAADFARSR